MIYLFHGEDNFLSYFEAQNKIALLSKTAAVTVLNVDEIKTINEFRQHTENIGLFDSQKIIFAKRVFQNKLVHEYLTDNFTPLEQNCEIVIWEDSKVPSNRKLIKLINPKEVKYFKQPRTSDIQAWLRNEIKNLKLENFGNLSQILISSVGENKWLLSNELHKLSLAHSSGVLNASNLNDFISKIDSFDIWKFLDNLARGRLDLVYKELDIILVENDVQYLISMIRRQLFILTLVFQSHSNDENLKALKIHPFAFQKAKEVARNYKWEEVKKLLEKLLSLDLSIKQGEIDAKLGLTLFLQLF